jgi:two-component system phosphate regulon response regulator PhoB
VNATSKPLILVVDDDAPILILMHSLLREFGFEPIGASSGADAIRLARERRPALMLLDKHMPGMGGAEVISTLRAAGGDNLGEMPILLLTGEPIGPQELQALGANGAIQKPFDINALLDQIRGFVGSAAAQS